MLPPAISPLAKLGKRHEIYGFGHFVAGSRCSIFCSRCSISSRPKISAGKETCFKTWTSNADSYISAVIQPALISLTGAWRVCFVARPSCHGGREACQRLPKGLPRACQRFASGNFTGAVENPVRDLGIQRRVQKRAFSICKAFKIATLVRL